MFSPEIWLEEQPKDSNAVFLLTSKLVKLFPQQANSVSAVKYCILSKLYIYLHHLYKSQRL